MKLFYAKRRCPKCDEDLTQDNAITLHFAAAEGKAEPERQSRLGRDGALVDAGGLVAGGSHLKSSCDACGANLKEMETGFR